MNIPVGARTGNRYLMRRPGVTAGHRIDKYHHSPLIMKRGS